MSRLNSKIIAFILAGISLLAAAGLGIAYYAAHEDITELKARQAKYCGSAIRRMMVYEARLRESTSAKREAPGAINSPEYDVAVDALHSSYYVCLVDAGVEHSNAQQQALGMSLALGNPSIDKATKALKDAVAELERHGY